MLTTAAAALRQMKQGHIYVARGKRGRRRKSTTAWGVTSLVPRLTINTLLSLGGGQGAHVRWGDGMHDMIHSEDWSHCHHIQ